MIVAHGDQWGAMDGLDRMDIFRIAGGRLAAAGSATPGIGTVLHAGGDAAQRAMVDEHERLHMELNGASAFGMLLSFVGQGWTRLPGAEETELLATLVELSRTPHEVYATTLSVSSLGAEARKEMLAQYPEYKHYLDIGIALAGEYPLESMVAQALVVGACVVSMQIPLHLLVGTREDWLREPLDVAPAHCPSCRLTVVSEIAASETPDLSWIPAQVEPPLLTGRAVDPYGSPEYKRAYHLALIRVYHQYALALSRREIPVLPWDEHLRYRSTHPHVPVAAGRFDREHLTQVELQALETATAAASSAYSPIRTSERQALRRATYGEAAAVVPLADVIGRPGPGLSVRTFARQDGPEAGLHLIVRPVEAVLECYSMSEEHAAAARAAATDGVLTAVRAAGQVGDRVDWLTVLAAISSKDDLEAVVRACIADPAIPPLLVSSISRSCLYSRGWRNELLTGLRYVTSPVQLEDLPPSLFLKSEADPDGINFTEVRLENRREPVPGFDPLRGIAIERNRAAGTVQRFTAIMGSGVLIHNLALRIAELPRAKLDNGLVASPVVSVMRRLGTEEPEFHFRGYEYIAPAELSEPEVDRDELGRWYGLLQELEAHRKAWISFARGGRGIG